MLKTQNITKSFKIKQSLYDQLMKLSVSRGVTFSKIVIESLEEKTGSFHLQTKKDYSIYSGILNDDDAKLFDEGIKKARFISEDRKDVNFE